MTSKWPMAAIGEVAEVFDGPHATPKTVEHGPIFLGIGALQNGRIKLGETRHVTPDVFKTWTRRVKPQAGDVVFSYETRLGEAAIIPDGFECCLGRRMALVRADRKRLEPRYFLYQFLSPYFQELIRSRTIPGATVDRIALKEFPSFVIPLPPLDEQRAIAETLGALDDRIDNLLQTNATLQAIATTLFKSWFVNFDGMSQEDMQESELGLIPKRWSVGSFDEAIEILGGGTPKTSVADYWNGDIPWFSVVDAPATEQAFVLDTQKKITALGLQNCSAKLLPEMTTIISARGTVGKVAMTGVPMAMNQSCYALRPKQQDGEAFVYLSTLRFVENLQRIAHGAVFDTITRDSFKQVKTCLPPDETIAEFAAIANPMLERIHANGLQAATLVKLRDTLLPRLISGQLRVKS